MAQSDTQNLTSDLFMGGEIEVLQPSEGYRAGTDPVLLAAAVPASAGQSVLELGCGVGVATLCLARRVSGLTLSGVELQPAYAALARRNARANGVAARIVTGDISQMPDDLRQTAFDHVIANPPYLCAAEGTRARDAGKERAFREHTPLATWVDAAARRLRPKGYLTLIHRVDRLPDLLTLLGGRLGSIEVKPLAPRQGRAAGRILVRARKGGRASFRLHAPLVLHDGAHHDTDAADYSPLAERILRHGVALHF